MRFDSKVSIKIRDAYQARHEPEAQRFLGSAYWAFLVTLLAMSILAALAFGAWEFMRPIDADDNSAASNAARRPLTRIELQKVLQAFDARADKFEVRRTNATPIKDPSVGK